MGEFFFIVLHCPNTRDIRPFGGLLCLDLELQESTTTTRSPLDETNHDQHGVSVFSVTGHMIRYLYFCGPFGFLLMFVNCVLLALQIYGFLAALQTLIQWHVAAASQSDRTGLLHDVG